MKSVSARTLAWEVLLEVERDGAYSNILLPRRLRESGLEGRDRAFVTELVYGSLRMRKKCDAHIAAVADRKIDAIDLKLLIALRLGVYQIKLLELPIHAAINESVELAKLTSGKGAAAYANAILRKVVDCVIDDSSMEDKYSHPQWIINSYRDALRDESALVAQLEANNQAAAPTLIAWPGRCEMAELVEVGAEPLEGSKVAARYRGNPGEIPAIRERRAGVQDLGSQLVVENFYATKDESELRWLDLCAGPGGKAAYLDSLLGSQLVANEPVQERAALLRQVVRSAKVTTFDGRQIPSELGKFDRILIDAPCTGIGSLRRRPELRWRRTSDQLRALIQLQSELIGAAATALRPGGVIGYATCSPHLAETKFQVRDFLRLNRDFHRIPVAQHGDQDGDMQLWTYRDGTDCMFLSLLQRSA